MIDKDLTGLSQILSSWIPDKIQRDVVPIVNRAEQTRKDINVSVYNKLRDSVNKATIANLSLNNLVMNRLDDRLLPIEGRIDRINRNVLDKIETGIIPLIPSRMTIGDQSDCPPCTNFVADPIFPHQGICEPLPGCKPPIVGVIDNVPIVPDQPVCPPQPICPPAQGCAVLNLFIRPCKEWDKNCVYFLPAGGFPLGPDDQVLETNIPCLDDNLKIAFAQGLQHCDHLKMGKLVCDNVPIIIEPPLVPFGGGVCGNPIINIQPPIGGVINNQPMPTMPIINEPIPPIVPTMPQPYPYPVPSGSFLNIQMICAIPGTKPGKCPPAGDMAYYSLECNDDSKIKELWNQICGKNLQDVFGNKNPVDWFIEAEKEILNFAMELNPLSPVLFPMGGPG